MSILPWYLPLHQPDPKGLQIHRGLQDHRRHQQYRVGEDLLRQLELQGCSREGHRGLAAK